MKNQNIVKLAIEALDYEDEDILDLREKKRIEMERKKVEVQPNRFADYFFRDGSCKAHDVCGCRECSHYANGRCPSYWEEHSLADNRKIIALMLVCVGNTPWFDERMKCDYCEDMFFGFDMNGQYCRDCYDHLKEEYEEDCKYKYSWHRY